MSDFNIRIKIDPTNAQPTIDATKRGLADLETMGPRVGGSVGKGLDQGAASAEKLRDKAKEAGDELGKIEGSFSQALGSRFGEVGNSLGELASKGTIAAAGVVGVGAAFVELSDKYAELENAATRLSGGLQATNDTLDQQLGLAGTLHASLGQTIELSTSVKERTADLNLTQGEQLRLTQSLGEAAALSGRSMQDAAGALDRVGFALQEGIPAGRAMKQIMLEFPPLADALKEHFHATGKEIIDMANKGQISLKEFIDATNGASAELDEKMGNRVVGLGTKLGHLKDAVIESKFGLENLANALNPAMLEMERATAAQNANSSEVKKNTEEIMTNVDAVQHLKIENSELVQTLDAVARAFADGNKIIDDNSKKYTDAVTKVKGYAAAVGNIRSVLDDLKSHGATGDLTRFLNAADVKTLRDYQDAQRDLADSGNRYGGIVNEIHKKEDDRQRGIADLNGALRAGVITQTEYNEAIKQYVHVSQAALEAEKARKELFRDSIANGLAARTASRANTRDFGFNPTLDVQGPSEDFKLPQADPRAQQALTLYDKTRTAAEKYGDELKDINSLSAQGYINDQAKTRILADLETRYGKVYSQAEQYAKALQDLDARTKVGLVSTASYGRELDALKMKFNQGDAMTGFREGLRQIEADINPAKDAQKTLVDGFNGVRDSITSLVTTGTADFGKLVDSLLADAARMGEDKLLKDLLGLGASGGVGGAAAAALGGAATGGDFDIPHAASGFAGVVRAPSGPDSHLAMFHVNPGEHVSIRTPEQMRSQGGGAPVNVPPTQVHVVMPDSRKQLPPPRSREMGEIVLVHIGERRSEIRAMLGIK